MAGTEFERQKEENRKNWGSMSVKQKLQFFADYYLLKTVIALAVIGIAAALLINFFSPHEESVLTVAVFDRALTEDAVESLSEEMKKELGVASDRYKTVRFLNAMSSDNPTDLSRFDTLLYSNEIDAVILGRAQYEKLAGMGTFSPLDEADGLFDAEKSEFIETPGVLESDDPAFDGSGQGEEKPYGVSLASSSRFADSLLGSADEESVFAIPVNAPNEENAVAFLNRLMNG